MTVSANAVFEMTRDGIIRRAMQRAQLLDPQGQPSGDYVSMAADFLNMELQSLAGEGVTLYQVSEEFVDFTAGTYIYELDADVIDVIIGADGFVGTTGDVSRAVAIDGHQYELLSDKSTVEAKYPTMVYIEKRNPLKMYFFPVPNDSSLNFYFQAVRLIKDVDTGAVTMDVARRWQKYIWLELAHQLAGAASKPDSFVKLLGDEAKAAKEIARRSDREMLPTQLYVPRSGGGCV